MNKKLINETIDYLNHCKNVFLDSDFTFEKSLGVTEIRDELAGITDKGKICYISHLFGLLSEEDKQIISSEIDFYVDFEELYAVYDLE